MSVQRWERLVATLADAGIESKVSERPHPQGITRSIWVRHGDHVVVISDKWWRKNADIWIGWQVYLEGPDSLELWHSPLTKKRSEVVAAVREALARI